MQSKPKSQSSYEIKTSSLNLTTNRSDYPVFSGPSYHQMTLSSTYEGNLDKQRVYTYQSLKDHSSATGSKRRLHGGQSSSDNGTETIVIDKSLAEQHFRKHYHNKFRLREIALICCSVFLFTVTVALIVIILHIYFNGSTTSNSNNDIVSGSKSLYKDKTARDFCLSHACLKSAAEMKEMMGVQFDPCSDAFRFSCAGWLNEEHIPPSASSWSRASKLQAETNQHLRDILEEPVTFQAPNSWEAKIKNFFESCISLEGPKESTCDSKLQTSSSSRSQNPLGIILNPCKDKRSLHNRIMCWQFEVGVETLFRMTVDTSPGDSKKQIIYLDEYMNTDFPTLSELNEPRRANLFRELVSSLTNAVGYLGSNVGASYADSVIQVLTSLGKISLADDDDYKYQLKLRARIFTVKDFVDRFKPVIQFEKFVAFLLYNDADRDVSEVEIAIGNVFYFSNLTAVIHRLREIELKKFFEFSAIFKFADFYTLDSRRIVQRYRALRQGAEHSSDSWMPCLEALRSPGLGALYLKDKVHSLKLDHIKKAVIPYIRKAFTSYIQNYKNSGLSVADRAMLNLKIRNTRIILSHESKYMDNKYLNAYYQEWKPMFNESLMYNAKTKQQWEFSRMRHRLSNFEEKLDNIDLTSVYPVYLYQENTIYLPTAFFQWPFHMWDDTMPFFLKFGIIGTSIASEMARAIDIIGLNWNNDNTKISSEKRLTFMSNASKDCVKDGLHKANGKRAIQTTTGSINTAFVYSLGLEVAFQAYNMYRAENGIELSLPAINYEPKQFFFISYTQKLCGKERKTMQPAVHRPYISFNTRVSLTLENSNGFRELFECKKERKSCLEIT